MTRSSALRVVASSDGLGWTNVVARVYEMPEVAGELVTDPASGLLVVSVLDGSYRIESRTPRGWESAWYRPGAVGVSAPGGEGVLRWRGASGDHRRSLHLHLPAFVLTATAAVLGERARPLAALGCLLIDDRIVASTVDALHAALRHRAGAAVADPLAAGLAARLLSTGPPAAAPPRPLDEQAVALAVDFMHAHAADPISLDDLARAARMSKYHFVRSFSRVAGVTPHQHLTRIRMQRAAALLATDRHPVAKVAVLCGYRSGASFGAVFRRHYGVSPTAYRAATAGR